MREVSIPEAARLVTSSSPRVACFCSGIDGHSNVMTVGWGGVTAFGEPCFLAPVRESRFTYGLLIHNGAFTVSVPLHDMRRELAVAGSQSGRETDKFTGFGMTAAPAQAVDIPIVKECELHIECVSMGHVALQLEALSEAVRSHPVRQRRSAHLFWAESSSVTARTDTGSMPERFVTHRF